MIRSREVVTHAFCLPCHGSATRRDVICRLDARTLKLKVELTRERCDKHRDLYKRQRLAIREQTGTKRGNSGAANARTKEKAPLCEELRARFQARYVQVTDQVR